MTHPQYQAPGTPAFNSEPPLWAPYYGAPFKAAVQRFFKKYATFSGRASRSEYWWWTLVSVLVSFVINIISGPGAAATTDFSTGTGGGGSTFGLILAFLWFAAVIVPSIALSVRRLHDVNMSGWLILIGLVPFLGALALLVIMILPPNPAGQRFDRPENASVGY
jgi:uncharacterized membrane protein YhaH (DUF805 family)